MSGESRLRPYQETVNARLADVLPPSSVEPGPLHDAMRYAVLGPGKRLRPALCLAASEAVGGTAADALDAACALELVHCFSLIHDDLPCIDDDDLRRGRPTVHKVYGEATALLAGDALFALAFGLLAEGPGTSDARIRAVATLARASGTPGGLVGGEVMDILSEGQAGDLETVSRIHAGKTGALIRAASEIGATLGGGGANHVAALAQYGTAVGLAFQIADDVLNETSTPEAIGKASGSDRERGKLTYPSVMGLDAARERAAQEAARAVAFLDGLPGDTDVLRELAGFSVSRSR